MTRIAKFYIEAIFEITGRGLVVAGRIVDGVISIGNIVELDINNNLLKREIIAVEAISAVNSKKTNVGLIIKCQGNEEIKLIIESQEKPSIINITTKN